MPRFIKKMLIGLLMLTLLCPLGLILPKMFNAGKAWGEWTTETVAKDKGFVPRGMKRDAGYYKAPVPDYNLGKEDDDLWKRSVNYILSGIIGVGAITLLTFGAIKLLPKK